MLWLRATPVLIPPTQQRLLLYVMSRSVVGPQEIAAIIDLHKAGISNKDIAKQKGLGVCTVQRWVKRYEDSGGTCIPAPVHKPGCPRITSPRTLKVILRQLKADPSLSVPEIKARNPRLLGHVSLRTVQQRIQNDLLLRSYKARKKPLLTDCHKSRRLQFAKKFIVWDIEEWKKVVWTDEPRFLLRGVVLNVYIVRLGRTLTSPSTH
ncbi:uncharacterized protein [Palaemon carinicauda]|uniref:uncharacterized protein n=1 Tax=Palaemon carinicauda TaxID=392227 RepID=UPI0035B670B2